MYIYIAGRWRPRPRAAVRSGGGGRRCDWQPLAERMDVIEFCSFATIIEKTKATTIDGDGRRHLTNVIIRLIITTPISSHMIKPCLHVVDHQTLLTCNRLVAESVGLFFVFESRASHPPARPPTTPKHHKRFVVCRFIANPDHHHPHTDHPHTHHHHHHHHQTFI